MDWLYAHPKSEWPAPYNGVTPNPLYALEYNNIASFHTADETLYACLRIYAGEEPGSIGGISEYDVGFDIVSTEHGVLQVSSSRPFNADKARNENNDLPECSGIFDTISNTYTDTIQAGNQVLRVSFELTNAAYLEFTLHSISEVLKQ